MEIPTCTLFINFHQVKGETIEIYAFIYYPYYEMCFLSLQSIIFKNKRVVYVWDHITNISAVFLKEVPFWNSASMALQSMHTRCVLVCVGKPQPPLRAHLKVFKVPLIENAPDCEIHCVIRFLFAKGVEAADIQRQICVRRRHYE